MKRNGELSIPKRELYEVICDMREVGSPVGLVRNFLDVLHAVERNKEERSHALGMVMLSLFEVKGI